MGPALVGQQRHDEPRIPAEQHRPGKRGGPEAGSDLVDDRVERGAALPVEWQHELDGAVVLEVRHGQSRPG